MQSNFGTAVIILYKSYSCCYSYL